MTKWWKLLNFRLVIYYKNLFYFSTLNTLVCYWKYNGNDGIIHRQPFSLVFRKVRWTWNCTETIRWKQAAFLRDMIACCELKKPSYAIRSRSTGIPASITWPTKDFNILWRNRSNVRCTMVYPLSNVSTVGRRRPWKYCESIHLL